MTADTRRRWLPGVILALCAAQMCERFSFYGVKGFLMPYLEASFRLTAVQAIHWYGLILAFFFLAPAITGFWIDRSSRLKAALLVSALLALSGYSLAASPALFLIALFPLIIGVGSLCASLPTAIDRQSRNSDYDLNSALTVGYMFTNIGALVAPYVCGTLAVKVSFAAGFWAAAAGMCLALPFLLVGSKGITGTAKAQSVKRPLAAPGRWLSPREKRQVMAVLLINALATVYWIGGEQSGGTLTDFAKSHTDLSLAGFKIPYTWFGSINPLLVLVISPAFVWLWSRGKRAGIRLSAAGLQAIALLLMGLSFVLMVGAEHFTLNGTKLVSPAWLAGVYALQTVGEFFVGPIGLALTIHLAPKRCKALMVGVWWASGTIASYLSGALTSVLTWLEQFGLRIDLWWFLAATILLTSLIAVLLASRLTALLLRRH